ncbi:MAG: sensor histidine kinase [Candidatus Hodarchaeales archaeon]
MTLIPFKTADNIGYARKLFYLTILTIFLCESLIMFFIEFVISSSPSMELILDSVLITVLMFPLLYLAVFKPLENDIKERERVEKALSRSKNMYQMLVENLREGVILEDTVGRISFANPRIQEMVRYSNEDIIGQHWSKITPPDESEAISRETAKRPQGVQSNYETNLLTKDGIRIPVLASANPIFDAKNNFQGVLTVLTDVSERKKMEEKQQRFVSAISHELRTPVTIIKGYIDFLQKMPHQPHIKMERVYKNLDSNIHRLLGLIDNVHTISKINQDVFTISPSQIDLNEYVQTIKDQCIILYPRRSILINYINNGNKDRVFIDEEKILQVLHNLINNAIKNSPPTSVVESTITKYPDKLQISVQDQGAGITFQNFFLLFRPFTHFNTQYSVKGSGLGLYIVKKIILAHGGSLEVLSQENFGSSFTINLPV